MRDLDAELVQAALEKGLITEDDRERIDELVGGSKGRLYGAQVMVRERMISTSDLITLQNNVRASIYECPHCKQRHSRKRLPKHKGKSFECKGCGAKVVEEPASLSRIEVLTSRDPRDLTVPLRAVISESASEISAIDLDRYEVEDELGRGGYGVVFKAHHKDLDRPVALKVLRSGVNLPEIALERFIREGRSVSRLKHPNIVSVYDIGRHRDLFMLAMEFVPGDSLKEHLKRRKRFPWREALELMDGVLAGVEYAHGEGIIHRDLKPTNIIMDEETGRPRLIDFGLAKDLSSDSALTQAGAIVGTPFYLSPEQIEGRSAEVDDRSDIFALGVILYLLLSGKRPFSSKLKQEVYRLILECKPAPLDEVCDDLPEGLAHVVHKAMARKAEDRYPNVTELRAALQEILGEATGAAPATKKKKTRSKRTTGKTQRHRAAALTPAASNNGPKLAIAVIGVLVVGLLGFLLGRGGDTPQRVAEKTAVEESESGPNATPKPTPKPKALPKPSPSPSPSPEPSPNPSPEPSPKPKPEPSPKPSPSPEDPKAEDDPAPEKPEPAPKRVEPKPKATPVAKPPARLDDGKQDPKEFPLLAKRSRKEWLKRAFFLNALADEAARPSPRTIRALRFGLRDRFPLNRAFALRGLIKIDDAFLRAHGSQALFKGLVDLVSEKEPYVRGNSQHLLGRLAKDPQRRSKSGWKKWWQEDGEALFRAAAANPPQLKLSAKAESRQAQRLTTRARKVTRYFSRLRSQGLDILFVIDVTLSMTDELARMRAQVNEITSFMDLLLKGKVRMGFVTYGDRVVQTAPLTRKLSGFARAVEGISIFNDPKDRSVPEGVSTGLAQALHKENRVKWRKKAVRTILLLGDAPPLDLDKCKKLAEQAGNNGFVINSLIAPPPKKYAVKWPPKPSFSELAKLGKGMAVEIQRPEELITRILVFAFGSSQERDLRRFVFAYREVTGANGRNKKPK